MRIGVAVRKEKQNMGLRKKALMYGTQYKDKGISSIILNRGLQRATADAFF